MDKENEEPIPQLKCGKYVTIFLIGVSIGCFIMAITHADIYAHYHKCQEQDLMDSMSKAADAHVYTIGPDSTGKIKIK